MSEKRMRQLRIRVVKRIAILLTLGWELADLIQGQNEEIALALVIFSLIILFFEFLEFTLEE